MVQLEMMFDPWAGCHPRWVLYARAHGAATTQEMMDRDVKRLVSGEVCGYSEWIEALWAEWYEECGRYAVRNKSAADHADFDRWLPDHVPPLGTTR